MSASSRGSSGGAANQPTLAGRYRLLRRLGHGGMAEVWAAFDETLEREVAVKVLSSRFADDEAFLRRFRREAQQAAGLSHPNIVAVYDTGQHGGLPFIVMELVRGRSLRQVLTEGELTEERALELCAEVSAALAYAHRRGLIHRDVKPDNILIADDGTVKVTDFGIARAVNSQTITETAAMLGTAAYLSPEQARGETVDARSDLYSLGVVLYEILTGRQPFAADSAVGVAYQHVQEDPLPPRQVAPTISSSAEAVAVKALAKNPANRYADAEQLRDDLLNARAGRTVTAPAVLSPDATAVLDREGLTTAARPPRTATQERRRRLAGYTALGLLTIGALAVGMWLLASALAGPTVVMRTVPDVTRLSPAEAERALAAHGLNSTFAGEDYSQDVPAGLVMAQDPDANARVPDSTEVKLTLSRGPEPVVVPGLAGRTEEQAIATLRDVGLAVGERRRAFSEDVRKDLVLGSEPPSGTQVDKGSTVTLVLSAGPERVIVPNVEGLLAADARFALEDRGFQVLTLREFSEDVAEGRVIRQRPAGNTRAPRGTEVTLVISAGSPQPPPPPRPPPRPSPEPSPSASPSPESSPTDGSLFP